MISEKDIRELQEITQMVFMLGERCVAQLLSVEIQRREFEVLSIDLAARFAYLSELIARLADELGMADYSQRSEVSVHIVGEAAKIYLTPLS